MKKTENGLFYGVKLRGDIHINLVPAFKAVNNGQAKYIHSSKRKLTSLCPMFPKPCHACENSMLHLLMENQSVRSVSFCESINIYCLNVVLIPFNSSKSMHRKYLCEWPGWILTRKLEPFNDDNALAIVKYLESKLEISTERFDQNQRSYFGNLC